MKYQKPYILGIAIILGGALLIALVWRATNKPVTILMGLTGFLLVVAGLNFLGNLLEVKLKEEHKGYKDPVEMTSPYEKILHYAGFAAGFTCIAAFTIAGRFFDNTINGTSFFFLSATSGLTLAIAYYFLLKFLYPSFVKPNEQRSLSIFITCIAIVTWTTIGSGYYNIQTASEHHQIKTIVVDKSRNVKTSTTYLFVMINGRKERFNPVKKEWDQLNEGDSVILETGTGKMNYSYVFHFKKPAE